MHESLITRGETTGTGLKIAIMTPENCVLVHPGCHIEAHKLIGRIKCAKYLIHWNGLRPIVEWLSRMQAGMVTTTEINDAKEMLELAIIWKRKDKGKENAKDKARLAQAGII